MINLITGRKDEYSEYELSQEDIRFAKALDFRVWLKEYDGMIQLDTETNIVEGMYGWKGYLKGKAKTFAVTLDEDGNRIPEDRKCYVVQIGDFEGDVQWIFDVPEMTKSQLSAMKMAFKCKNKKLIHNALFDYSVVKWNFGIDMDDMVDTFMMSKATTTGLTPGEHLPKGYNSLAGCAKRILKLDISKEAQTTFNGDAMTAEQIKYAAIDVVLPGAIYPHLLKEVEYWGVQNVVNLESSLPRSYGDAMCENLYLDDIPWLENVENQKKTVASSKKALYEIMNEYFYDECRDMGFFQRDDEYKFNWASSTKKKAILRHIYPDMPETCTTIKSYKEYYETLLRDESVTTEDRNVLLWLLNRDFDKVEKYFISNHNEFLKTIDIYFPKDTILINLNSSKQKLALFKLIDPEVESTGREVLEKISHPLASKFREYSKATKLVSSYGTNFIEAKSPDGMFRIKSFQQILNTGRSSMSMMQLLPKIMGRLVETLNDNLFN